MQKLAVFNTVILNFQAILELISYPLQTSSKLCIFASTLSVGLHKSKIKIQKGFLILNIETLTFTKYEIQSRKLVYFLAKKDFHLNLVGTPRI